MDTPQYLSLWSRYQPFLAYDILLSKLAFWACYQFDEAKKQCYSLVDASGATESKAYERVGEEPTRQEVAIASPRGGHDLLKAQIGKEYDPLEITITEEMVERNAWANEMIYQLTMQKTC